MIREGKIKSGPLLEVDFYPVFADGRRIPRRAPKTKRSTKEQEKYNQKQATLKFIRIINANFGTGDHLLTITYIPEYAPQTEADARRDIANYIRRVKTRRRSELKLVNELLKEHPDDKRLKQRKKQLEKPFKYAYTLEKVTYQRGKYAGRANWHIHMFATGGVSRDDMEDIWHKGVRVNADRYQPERFGPEAAAKYISKDPQGSKRFVCSRNMDKPQKPPPRDDKITRRGLERLARERADDPAYWERRYKGYRLLSCYARLNPYNGYWYVSVVMYKTNNEILPKWEAGIWTSE